MYKFGLPRYLSLVIKLVLLCIGTEAACAQDAIVTFYSHGSFLTTGIPGTKQDLYFGNIFDERQGLFRFHDGLFGHNNRYITLRFPPGPHLFGASNGKRPEARESLSIDLKPGERYFVRAQGESKGVPGILTVQHGRLDRMTCAEAVMDLKDAKPLKEKAIWKEMRTTLTTRFVEEVAPFSCQ